MSDPIHRLSFIFLWLDQTVGRFNSITHTVKNLQPVTEIAELYKGHDRLRCIRTAYFRRQSSAAEPAVEACSPSTAAHKSTGQPKVTSSEPRSAH